MGLRNIIFAIILLFGFVMGNIFYSIFIEADTEEKTETVQTTETKIDWVKKDTTIYNYRDSVLYRFETIQIEASDKPEKYDSIRTYSNIHKHLYGYTSWRAKVGGELIEMTLKPSFEVPIETITNNIETTKTVIVKPKGFYAVAGVTDQFNYNIGAAYLNDRTLFGYTFDIRRKEHGIKLGFKIK